MENNNIEDSQNADRPSIPVVNGEAKPSNGKTGKILFGLLTFVLVAGLGASLFLLQEERQRVNQFSDQAYGLLQDKAKLEAENQSQLPQGIPQAGSSKELSTVYKADVGKFTLTLSGKYFVVEQLDGTFEGEPATDIWVGINMGNGVISNPFQSNLSILAGASNFTTEQFSKYIKDQLKGHIGYKKAESVKIDGQDAQVYEIDNFPPQKNIFFQSKDKKNEYEIRVADNSENFKDTKTLLEDTIAGFKFN